MQNAARQGRLSLEVGEGGGFGVKGRNGFDEARNGEGVAHTAGPTNQTQVPAFARELDGNAHQRGKPGAVNLRRAVEGDDDVARALLYDGLQGGIELLARLADREPSMHFEDGNSAGLSNVDFHG